jgi:hypothetical protein
LEVDLKFFWPSGLSMPARKYIRLSHARKSKIYLIYFLRL